MARRWHVLAADYDKLAAALEVESAPAVQRVPMQQQPQPPQQQQQQFKADPEEKA